MSRGIAPDQPLDLWLTLGPLARGGAGDPSVRLDGAEIWRATRTPAGIATQRLRPRGQAIEVEAWGPGAEWLLEHAPALLGEEDDDRDFAPTHPILRELHRQHAGLRLLRTESVMETLVPTVLEQKVAGVEARHAYRRLIGSLGEAAPGPTPLIVPPSPQVLASTPYWTFRATRPIGACSRSPASGHGPRPRSAPSPLATPTRCQWATTISPIWSAGSCCASRVGQTS